MKHIDNYLTRTLKVFAFAALVTAPLWTATPATAKNIWISSTLDSYYGAIVYSPATGRFGSSWSFLSPEDAEASAMKICDRVDCRVLVPLEGNCGALAVSRTGGYAWGEGRSLYDAKLNTSNQCTQQYGGCKLICSVCSRGDQP